MDIARYRKEIENELYNILSFWDNNTVDKVNGGFYGRISNEGEIFKDADKSAVLNTRILWTYSAAYRELGDEKYLKSAKRAYSYLREHFKDEENGGIFWLLDARGTPRETKKQIYAQASCIYALSEYYKITKDEDALNWAKEIFDLIEKKEFRS